LIKVFPVGKMGQSRSDRLLWHGTLVLALFMIGTPILVNGCFRGRSSENPPINLNPNMDNQPRYDPQSESKFFTDGSSMRPPVPGTVAREELREDPGYFRGRSVGGEFLKHSPVTTTMPLLKRGQERFNIFCSPCHGQTGDGRGIVVQRGYLPPPSFHQDRVRQFDDGYIFDVISNGVRNMPSYRHEVPVGDRWAIIAYLRALQRSQNAPLEDVSEEVRKTLR